MEIAALAKLMADLHQVMLQNLISGCQDVLGAFYAKVRADTQRGPILNGAIGDRCDPNLAKLAGFWSSDLLITGRFIVQPAHTELHPILTQTLTAPRRVSAPARTRLHREGGGG